MLEELFLTMLEVSVASSAVILLMLLTAPATGKRFSAKWRYWVWLVLALRLLLPVNFTLPQAPVKLTIPVRQVIVTHTPEGSPETIENPAGDVSRAPVQGSPPQPEKGWQAPQADGIPAAAIRPGDLQASHAETFTVSLLSVLTGLWAAGAILALLWQAFAYWRFRQRLAPWNAAMTDKATGVMLEQLCAEMDLSAKVGLYQNKLVKSPMMTGLLSPVILLPERPLSRHDLLMVLRHELTHLRRHDLWYQLVLVLASSVNWFNPFVRLMLREADRDLEISCDEAVVKGAGMEFRRQYCETILRVMRGGVNRPVLTSTGFYGGKRVLQRRFSAVLNSNIRRGGIVFAVMLMAVACSGPLLACAYGEGVSPAPPMRTRDSQTAAVPPMAIDDTKLLGRPLPAGPDASGRFPAISSEDFDRWVTYGEPDAVRPDNSTITPFLQSAACTDYLTGTFPEIDDWQVLYEYHTYTLREDLYDPYRFQWRDQYMPNHLIVLSTAQSKHFDRIALVGIEECAVIADTVLTPTRQTLIYCCTGWESVLRMGDLLDAQPVFTGENGWYPSLWLPQRQRAFLLDFNVGNILPVSNAAKPPPVVFFNFDTSAFALGEDGQGNRLVTVQPDEARPCCDWYYYDARAESLRLFAGCTGDDPQYFPLDGTTLALQSENEICLYDLSSATPTRPIAVIGGNGNGLSDKTVRIMHQLATDRNYGDLHACMYYADREQVWRICSFDSGGEILCDVSTGLPVVGDTVESIACAGGLVYFTYHSGHQASRRSYCVDARGGQDHTLQRIT